MSKSNTVMDQRVWEKIGDMDLACASEIETYSNDKYKQLSGTLVIREMGGDGNLHIGLWGDNLEESLSNAADLRSFAAGLARFADRYEHEARGFFTKEDPNE